MTTHTVLARNDAKQPARHSRAGRAIGLGLVAAVVTGLLVPAVSVADATGSGSGGGTGNPGAATSTGGTANSSVPAATIAVVPPAIPGVAALPGPMAPAAQPSPNMGILAVTPDQAVAGKPFTVATTSGSNLSPNTSYSLTWSTGQATWNIDPEPSTVNYLGRASTLFSVVLANVTTDASGRFSVKLTAPADYGGIHDIYAVANGQEDAHGGFILMRTLSISPTSGPVGTPITVTYTGLGNSLYAGGASLLYDNHYAGEMMANWTRGTAQVVIRAAGPVGRHLIQVGDAISYLYYNIAQSPLPFAKGGTAIFTVTKDDGPPPARIDWPVGVSPTVDSYTTMQSAGLTSSSSLNASLSSNMGAVGSQVTVNATGLPAGQPVNLVWSTVVGNRVNCSGTCWSFVSTDLDPVTASASGAISQPVTVPDGLGGWHVIQVMQNNQVVAQLPFYVRESIYGRGISSITVKENARFTIHVKGVGWTQVDNTLAIDYDNSYVGYACGFNSNGDVVIPLHATGAPGTHLIDLYPMLYTNSPSFANTPYGMVPLLSYAHDDPSLALGYHPAALRFAINVVP
jgi:hypothetical protein